MSPKRLLSLAYCFLFSLSFYSTDGYPATGPGCRIDGGPEKHPTVVRVPFHKVGNLIIVKGSIDGREGNFIVDTGAPSLVLNKNKLRNYQVARKLNSVGVTGNISQVYKKGVRRFQLSDARISNISALVMDLSHIERIRKIPLLGLIGYRVLKNYEISFDFKNRQLLLYALGKKGQALCSSGEGRPRPTDSISFNLLGHLPCIRGQFGSKAVLLGIDSGAEINLINKRLKPILENRFSHLETLDLHGLGKQKVPSSAGVLRSFWIACIKFDQMATMLTDINHFQPLGNGALDGLLGYEFLRQRKMSINFKKKKLFFWGPEEEDCHLAAK